MSLLPFLLIFLSVYGLANFYVFIRLRQALKYFYPRAGLPYFPVFFLLFAAAFLLGRTAERYLPFWLSDSLTIIGSYWLGVIYYLFLLLLCSDLLAFAGRRTGLLRPPGRPFPLGAVASVLLTCGLVAFGWWNARAPVIRHYEVTIPKSAGPLNQVHAVMVSDIHLGKFVTARRLDRLVDTVNQLQPDLVLLPGDIIDEDVDWFTAAKMPAALRRIRAPLGVYGALGNHEYIRGKPDLAVEELSGSGITILRDRYVKVADSFYIAGRDDRSRERSGGRKNLPDILRGMDPALPVILLDHQPARLEQAAAAGVDLQLSGHTHRGQLFPNNYLTHALYETDWGYLRKNTLQIIVSCGYGTWGPPIRIGNRPEIVDITIYFIPPGEGKI